MKPHILTRTTIIKKPLLEVFDFFSKAENLNVLTPPELHFTILTPLPIQMKNGALIDYSIKLNGIPFKWKTEIEIWNPPHQFVDQQLKGPYVRWHHTHNFKSLDDHTTEMTDIVEYLSPGWILEPVITALIVRKRVEAIFDYREKKLHEIFS
ncbi:MAG: SRPBCC family protein [Bacteroidia bacterium]|jgi:ligand-binding SRPBCC domain-containing protein|nr:SRPBCC family protein [Bacteroidia bacterium]